MSTTAEWLNSQLLVRLPYPSHSFSGQTVIVTGANTGLGLEAARHFVRLRASKVILACRSTSKAEAAKLSIEASTQRYGVVSVEPLDLSSYASVKEFATRMTQLERLDVVVQNAGIATLDYERAEDNEATITVNVVSTMLLALLLLPKLRESAERFDMIPRMVILSSDVHVMCSFSEWKTENAFATLNDPSTANMEDRYSVSKLLSIFSVRALAAKTQNKTPPVAINVLNPGFCYSELTRNVGGLMAWKFTMLKALFARSTEYGSRTLVHAASVGWESHGKYMSDGKLNK